MDESTHNRDEILNNYTDCIDLLRGAIEGLEESDLDISSAADEWSIREIIHHLADGDHIWKTCALMALGESDYPYHLKWYWASDQLSWSRVWKYSGREIKPSLDLLEANRKHLVEMLKAVPEALSKTIIVEWPGHAPEEINVAWVLEMQTSHVKIHAQEIKKTRADRNI